MATRLPGSLTLRLLPQEMLRRRALGICHASRTAACVPATAHARAWLISAAHYSFTRNLGMGQYPSVSAAGVPWARARGG